MLYVPGEHDFDGDGNKEYLKRYGKGTQGTGWYSFDHQGVHFVGLVNVANAKSGSGDGGLGVIGDEQLEWLEKDVAGLKDSTPIVVFAHVPLWTVYEKWGWGTRDAEQALEILKRFGSLTVLNGHIHQVLQKVEGKVTFHTARSTAFPQSEPGKGTPGADPRPAGRASSRRPSGCRRSPTSRIPARSRSWIPRSSDPPHSPDRTRARSSFPRIGGRMPAAGPASPFPRKERCDMKQWWMSVVVSLAVVAGLRPGSRGQGRLRRRGISGTKSAASSRPNAPAATAPTWRSPRAGSDTSSTSGGWPGTPRW